MGRRVIVRWKEAAKGGGGSRAGEAGAANGCRVLPFLLGQAWEEGMGAGKGEG